jgi:hypothetical protein
MNEFIGTVLPFVTPAPPAHGTPGTYLLSSRAAVQLGPGGIPVFDGVIGRGPRNGEQFRWFDPPSQLFQTTTYASGAWTNGPPALNIGQSAFFILLPEPSSFAASVFVVALAFGSRRSRVRAFWDGKASAAACRVGTPGFSGHVQGFGHENTGRLRRAQSTRASGT